MTISKKYILGFEYYNDTHISIEYRGHKDRLWKGNFVSFLNSTSPDLADPYEIVLNSGILSKIEKIAGFFLLLLGGLIILPESLKAKFLHSGFQDVQVNYRHTTNPSLPILERLGLLMLKASSHLMPLKSFYTHFYIIGRR